MTPTEQDDELLTLLRNEERLLAHVLELAGEQQRALINFDAETISLIALEQERYSKQMMESEKKRIAVLRSMIPIGDSDARAMTMSDLCNLVDENLAAELRSLRDRMGDYVSKIQFLNNVNRVLALRGRNSAKATLDFIRSERVHVVNTSL